MYLLLKEKISPDDINQAKLKLNSFVDSFEILYGQNNVTMNFHLVRHFPTAVEHTGPLWAQSAYGFEANNGVVISRTHVKKNLLHQLSWKYCMKQSLKNDNVKSDAFSIGKKSRRRLTWMRSIFSLKLD